MAEKAMRRSALLAEASRLLSRSLDFDATLASLHRTVVPSLADACQLVLYDANRDIWFAPLCTSRNRTPLTAMSRAPTRASSRSTHSLAEAVREAVESGHAQTDRSRDRR